MFYANRMFRYVSTLPFPQLFQVICYNHSFFPYVYLINEVPLIAGSNLGFSYTFEAPSIFQTIFISFLHGSYIFLFDFYLWASSAANWHSATVPFSIYSLLHLLSRYAAVVITVPIYMIFKSASVEILESGRVCD